ncbi:MAG TPA: response regulator transcription factor [Cyclobacteriaceae bacterium]|jgi:DNA-binding response OmpR family regulator|nr:response regulator transcription factor [Cyclobacteriaceae bacterium]
MPRVLIIEDDIDIAELISIHLNDLVCEIKHCINGETGFEKAAEENFDLIILDIMLPGIDGLEVCKKLRAREITTPVLMLTAKSEEIDKVLGLEIGADDYLTKPFSIREFVARVKAILRRQKIHEKASTEHIGNTLRIENLVIEHSKHKVMLNGTRVELTPKEYDLLVLLAAHPGKSYNREDLLNLIWGYEFSGYEHTVNSHINRLRSKIESDFSKPRYILTSWGVGYRFNDELLIEKISM